MNEENSKSRRGQFSRSVVFQSEILSPAEINSPHDGHDTRNVRGGHDCGYLSSLREQVDKVVTLYQTKHLRMMHYSV